MVCHYMLRLFWLGNVCNLCTVVNNLHLLPFCAAFCGASTASKDLIAKNCTGSAMRLSHILIYIDVLHFYIHISNLALGL